MTDWFRIDQGKGRPLVLLHGGGATTRTWLPVLDQLAEDRRVIAFDFPGFGRTPIPDDVEFTMEWMVREFVAQLAAAGVDTPVDIAGNSMGGWVALEAAKLGIARSVVAFGPAGLWRNGMPPLLRAKFRAGLLCARAARGREDVVLHPKWVRSAAYSQLMSSPQRVAVNDAVAMLAELDACRTALVPILRVARTAGFTGGQAITAPITIAYGDRERMLAARSGRVRDELPSHTRWVELAGCGHVPMWDNPELVARTILAGTM